VRSCQKWHTFQFVTIACALFSGTSVANESSPFSPLFIPDAGKVITQTSFALSYGQNSVTISGGLSGRMTDAPRFMRVSQSVRAGLPWDGFQIGAGVGYSESLKADTDRTRYMEGFGNPSFWLGKSTRLDAGEVIHLFYNITPKTGNEGLRSARTTQALSVTGAKQFVGGMLGSISLRRWESSFAGATSVSGGVHKDINGLLWGTSLSVSHNDRQKSPDYEFKIPQNYTASVFASRQLSPGVWGGVSYSYWQGKSKVNVNTPIAYEAETRMKAHTISTSIQASF